MRKEKRMNVDIDKMLEKWATTRNSMNELEKKIDNYKKIMKQYLKRNDIKKYENGTYKVSLSNHERTSIQKKDIPKDIWNMYAKSKDVEYLTLTETKPKKASQRSSSQTTQQQQIQQMLR